VLPPLLPQEQLLQQQPRQLQLPFGLFTQRQKGESCFM